MQTVLPWNWSRGRFRGRFIIAAVAFAFMAMYAATSLIGGPSAGAGHVEPRQIPDNNNPDCVDAGYGFGFKIDGSTNGTYPLVDNDPHELTGGAPSDPANSITIFNSDGITFDWTATLGIDAVIVKGGTGGANVYDYDPEASTDTGLHTPTNQGLSHIEFCYDYELDVSKTAETTFTRTFGWEIDKSVTPEIWDLFKGDSGTSEYTVSVTKGEGVDSDWAVSGTITIENNTPLDASITGVSDAISVGIVATVDCGVTLPTELAAGATLDCTYEADLPDDAERLNTATVETSGVVGGGEATADVEFGEPTTLVNDEINVDDTFAGDLGSFSDDGSVSYSRTFDCNADDGTHGNTATIVETGQSDDASVTVNCYELAVGKDAATSFTRTWEWTIEKSADQTGLTLAAGESFQVNYEVTVDTTSTDSAWAVEGEITITNPHPTRAANLTGVSDVVSPGIAATVDCPSLTVPAGSELVCAYSGELPDDAERTNTATAIQQNYDYGADGSQSDAGTTAYTAFASVVFDNADVTEVDECIDVSDTLGGNFGTVCADAAPVTFDYSHTVGPYEVCGEYTVDNRAAFVTNDTETEDSDSWIIDVIVPCGGCTLTPGYWKTHSDQGPAPFDETWDQIGEDTIFFLSGQTYYQVLWTAPMGNAYYNLSFHYIAAELNMLNGAAVPANVQAAFDEATDLFNTYDPGEVGAWKGKQGERAKFIELAGILGAYNEGSLGPGHCDEDGN